MKETSRPVTSAGMPTPRRGVGIPANVVPTGGAFGDGRGRMKLLQSLERQEIQATNMN